MKAFRQSCSWPATPHLQAIARYFQSPSMATPSSAVILRREGAENNALTQGPLLLGVEAMTLGHLQKAITMARTNGHPDIVVDALCMEREVMPVYFLNMLRVMNQALAASSLSLKDIDHFIYSNISRRDREGFCKMVRLPKGSLPATPMAEYGHTFASDLVINYVNMRRDGLIRPGPIVVVRIGWDRLYLGSNHCPGLNG